MACELISQQSRMHANSFTVDLAYHQANAIGSIFGSAGRRPLSNLCHCKHAFSISPFPITAVEVRLTGLPIACGSTALLPVWTPDS